MRSILSCLAASAPAGGLIAVPPADDDLGLPVFTGGDPVPDEPARHDPRRTRSRAAHWPRRPPSR